MVKLKFQRVLCLILFSFLSLASLMSCSDNEEETANGIEETISYVKIAQSDLQGWDSGFVKDNEVYAFYKDIDEDGNRFLHFTSSKSKSEISIVFRQDSIIGFSYDKKFYSISQNETQMIISGIDNEYITTDVIDLPISNKRAINIASTQTRADNIGLFDALMTACDFWEYAQTAQSLNENFSNQLWNEFFSDLGNAVAIGLLGKLLGNMVGSASVLITAPFAMVHGAIEQSVKNNAAKIYSSSSVEISEIRKGSDEQIEIYVTLHNVNTIPEYLYRYYEPETNETTRNRVYCGVVGRYSGLPTYHTHDKQFKTEEVEIPTDGSVSELYLMFTIPSVGHGRTIKFRPYMKSTRIKNIWGDVDESFIRYGSSVDYTDVNGTILSVNKIDATPGVDDSNMPFIHFTYEVKAQIESLDNIEEWGVYVLNEDGTYLTYPSEFKAAKLEDNINIDNLNFNYNEFEEINFSSFYVSKQVKLGVYYKMKNPQGVYDYLNYYYGTPQVYKFEYDQKPNIELYNVTVTGIEPYSDDDGRDLLCRYTYTLKANGSFFFNNIIAIHGDHWTNPGYQREIVSNCEDDIPYTINSSYSYFSSGTNVGPIYFKTILRDGSEYIFPKTLYCDNGTVYSSAARAISNAYQRVITTLKNCSSKSN